MRADLHIHTCLSPCGDNDMTPNNIVNMAILNGLDTIAITDHNSALNCRAVFECGKKAGLKVVPGIEVTTAEEVHLLCYFDCCDSAEAFGNALFEELPDIMNRPRIFGDQIVMNELDQVLGNVDKLLISAVKLSIEQIIELVKKHNGEVIPAHVDRDSYSILSNLGGIPEEYGFEKLELSTSQTISGFLLEYPQFRCYKLIQSSDAHYLHQIIAFE